jgi:hypothetical protein
MTGLVETIQMMAYHQTFSEMGSSCENRLAQVRFMPTSVSDGSSSITLVHVNVTEM